MGRAMERLWKHWRTTVLQFSIKQCPRYQKSDRNSLGDGKALIHQLRQTNPNNVILCLIKQKRS